MKYLDYTRARVTLVRAQVFVAPEGFVPGVDLHSKQRQRLQESAAVSIRLLKRCW